MSTVWPVVSATKWRMSAWFSTNMPPSLPMPQSSQAATMANRLGRGLVVMGLLGWGAGCGGLGSGSRRPDWRLARVTAALDGARAARLEGGHFAR